MRILQAHRHLCCPPVHICVTSLCEFQIEVVAVERPIPATSGMRGGECFTDFHRNGINHVGNEYII